MAAPDWTYMLGPACREGLQAQSGPKVYSRLWSDVSTAMWTRLAPHAACIARLGPKHAAWACGVSPRPTDQILGFHRLDLAHRACLQVMEIFPLFTHWN